MVLGKSLNDGRMHKKGYFELPILKSSATHAAPPRNAVELPRSAFEKNGQPSQQTETVDAFDGGSSDSQERRRLVEAMEQAGWVQAKAARLLGLTSRQMGYALRKFSIEIKRF
jgi:Nif-specific regulatory protein